MDDDKCFSDLIAVEILLGFGAAIWEKEFTTAKKLSKSIAVNVFIFVLISLNRTVEN